MSRSYQQEIPKSRVNITLDVDTQGAKEKKELPLKLLVIGNFSRRKDESDLADRPRLSVNKTNINQAMKKLSPSLSLTLGRGNEKNQDFHNCQLTFQKLDDFSPDSIVQAVPQLKKLLAMRYLLKDLKASVLDNYSFRLKLGEILKDQKQSDALKLSLSKQSGE